MGISFVEYVLRLRIRDATVRLASTDEAVARIASDCGFADVKAFNVAFKKHFNMTPQNIVSKLKALGVKPSYKIGKKLFL